MPEETLTKLPSKARVLWERAFTTAKKRGLSVSTSARVAWTVIKNPYKKSSNGEWVLRSGVILNKESLILRSYNTGGVDFVEGYFSTFARDGGDLSGPTTNNGYSTRLLPSAARQLAVDLVSQGLGGGVEHDTIRGSEFYNPNADKVLEVVEARVDDKGLWGKVKLLKRSARYESVKKQLDDGTLRGFSVEFFPKKGPAGYKLTLEEGTPIKNIHGIRSTIGVSFTERPLEKDSVITKVDFSE